MHSIVYNFITDRSINGGSESMALRCAYLLSDGVTSAGSSYATIGYDSFFSQLNIENKIKQIERNAPEEFKEMGGSSEEVINILRMHKKIKHPTPFQIIAFKKLLKSLENLWQVDHQEALNKMMLMGLPQLEPLTKSKEINMLAVINDNPEEDGVDCYPASRILNLDFEEEADNDVFFINFEFMLDPFQKKLSRDKKPFYMEHVFTFPNLNVLTADELRVVKANLKTDTEPFRKKVDEWIKGCTEKSAKETRSLFYDEIKPLTLPIQKKIEQDSILLHVDSHYVEKPRIDVLMGEVPLLTVWAYYHSAGVIPEMSWKILEELSGNRIIANKRVPVLTNRVSQGSEIHVPELRKAELILPTRKTLDID